jgi:hypothetical protein
MLTLGKAAPLIGAFDAMQLSRCGNTSIEGLSTLSTPFRKNPIDIQLVISIPLKESP